ncbi:L-ribulose-5-phosphate 4-epimerase [Anaerolinea thermophila UNI-1]|uniref:L-ribulose-5-phosphate 4-epimerase n=1 Tax=Anaerolinea thermophila (strain DSM 14523 / JCM 11388 / NBRC 100420 / UNI-1) TaxID=926569 RepID=E8N4N0_ANATU|nr:L-ribulose-5-phosphate 4-epimerase [Anaerolinea thermophila]BAJ63394.1 L-ribulose-5-phosphate 4-epimerase [Anaerolinea thermophila UNI-1]
MLLPNLREELLYLHLQLPKNGLVTWTSGNVSVRDVSTGWVLIKPSGVFYENLHPEDFILLDLDGNVLEGSLKPSSDTASHLYIYRHRPDVNGIVHTHSPYATAFAAVGKAIPVYLTAQADEFGGAIPCAGLGLIGGEEIGKLVVETIGTSPGCLLQNHGVFTIGKDGSSAVKAAVMIEDIAKTVWLAMQLGTPIPIPEDMVQRLHQRYTRDYGQG